MSVLVFDPAYSKYMPTLGKALAKALDCPCEAVLSAYAYKVYCPDLSAHVYKSPEGPLIQPRCQGLTSSDIVWGKEKVGEYRSLYFTWLSNIFDCCRPKLCMLHNEKFLLCTLAIELCEKNNIPYVVLERGAYRPFTTTCDWQGTNANSCFRKRDHDEDISLVDVKKAYRIGADRRAENFIYLKFLFFLVMITLENIVQPGKRFLQHKKFSLLSYAMIALGFAKRKVPTFDKAKDSSEGEQPGKYILVPLQRPGDTQLTFVEGYPGMQEFIDLVVKSARQAAPESELIFKSHPYDTASYDFHGHRHERRKSIPELLEDASLVVTYNSTAGFEALCQDVPVVCLGESFYTKEEYVYKPESLCLDDIVIAVQKAVAEGCKRRGNDVMANVLYYYQVPGSMYKYDAKDIASAVNYILKDLYR